MFRKAKPLNIQSLFFYAATVCLAVFGGCAQSAQNAVPPAAGADTVPSLAIRDITVIDAVNGTREHMNVWLEGDQIVAVEPHDNRPLRATQVIDGRGKYLIPGLWDMHVHITYEPELTAAMPALFLNYGVTAVRDTGGMLPLLLPEVDNWRTPGAQAPRIFYSGPLLDGTKVVYDGQDRPEIGIANATPAMAASNVQSLVDAGVDFIKIYELVSPEVFKALIQEAQRHQLPIAAHVPLALLADQAGPQVGSMEHLRNVELACSQDADELLAERAEIIADPGERSGYSLRSALHAEYRPRAFSDLDVNSPRCSEVIGSLGNTIQVPTLRLNTMVQYSPLAREDWLEHLNLLPVTIARRWRSAAGKFIEQATPNHTALADWSLQLVSAMQAASVPIGAGTDTPIGQAIPGYSLHTELERLVDAGLSPMQALQAATVRPAEFLGLASSHGLIQPGYAGDLVVLRANPLVNIRHTRSIERVISRGRVVR